MFCPHSALIQVAMELILKKIFVGRKQKKKDLKKFSVYTEYVSNFPRGEMKYVRGSRCEWVWVSGSERSVPQP